MKNIGFSCFKLSDAIFILLISVKMPTIVGILTFMSRINFILSLLEHEKRVYNPRRCHKSQTNPWQPEKEISEHKERHTQQVTSLIADPGVVNSIPAQSHIFVDIDHEIFSTFILPLPLIQERLVSVTRESMCTKHWSTA